MVWTFNLKLLVSNPKIRSRNGFSCLGMKDQNFMRPWGARHIYNLQTLYNRNLKIC